MNNDLPWGRSDIMATVHESPSSQNRGEGRKRGFTHTRRAGTQMDPSQFAAMNGTKVTNGSLTSTTTVTGHESHHHSTSSTDTIKAIQQDSSHLELPRPPSFSTPTMERSKSMERRKSVGLPAHLSLQGAGYGLPMTKDQKVAEVGQVASVAWISKDEALAAILIPLPFAVVALANGFGILPRVTLAKTTFEDLHGPILGKNGHTMVRSDEHLKPFELAFGITALTFLFVGLGGLYRQSSKSLPAPEKKEELTDKMERQQTGLIARKIAARVFGLGLPLYASSLLGFRVILVMLSAMAADFGTQSRSFDFTTSKAWIQMASRGKFTLAAMLTQIVFDLAGFTNRLPLTSILIGYLTLGLSIFFLPPPYSSTNLQGSVATMNGPSSVDQANNAFSYDVDSSKSMKASLSSSPWETSPLTATRKDVYITTWSGAILLTFTFLIFLSRSGAGAGASMTTDLLWMVSSAIAFTLSLVVVRTHSLKSGKGFGFLLGSFATYLILSLTNSEWIACALEGVLIMFTLVATRLDTHYASSHSHSNHQHHYHAKPHVGEHGQVSQFTEAVLQQVRGWPLLYNIISEKDSRRIFYFMWYAP